MAVVMTIDNETCSKCGLCFEVCPAMAISWEKGQFPVQNPVRREICIECGQCMAVCPNESIITGDMNYESDFTPLAREHIGYQDFIDLTTSRRSIRNFKDKPVPRDLLEKIVAAIAQAPMGFPPHKTELTVIQNRGEIEKMLPYMIDFYDRLLKWFANPVKRFFIKRDAGPETFSSMQNHLIPILKIKMPDMKKGGRDEIARGAPVLILFHAKKLAESHTNDAYIAVGYGLLAAHALGLGATAISLIPPAISRSPELRQMLQLEDDQEVTASMIVGYPRFRYQRGVLRSLARVRWM